MKHKNHDEHKIFIDIEYDPVKLLIFAVAIQVILILGKLIGLFNISWSVAFLPTFGFVGFFLLVFLLAMMINAMDDWQGDVSERR